jgi:geranylgeranyl pyrophosphate synthase
MSNDSKLRGIKRSFKQKGGTAMKTAKKNIIVNFNDDSYISQALRYFANVTLHSPIPVFPALITMSCEAVEGDTEKVAPFAEAIVFITASADLHDDVIDQSVQKNMKQTVFGRYGLATTILAGDILLAEGFKRLGEAINQNPEAFGRVMKLVTEAVSEICSAEILEIQLHNRQDFTAEKFMKIIQLKAVVPELTMKIGAIIGGGNSADVERLGQFGRAYGITSIIVEEFADLLDFEELKRRLKNECPPLPIICALENPQIKSTLLPWLDGDSLQNERHQKIIEIVLESNEVKDRKSVV